MNDPDKILNVNSSSLVDLKAELIRKQQEFRKEKATGGSKSALLAAKRAAHKKVSVFSKKNVGVQERALRDLEEKGEEDRELDRSRSILEAKAKLYEKMTTGGRGLDLPDDEDGGRFLVDFQKKAVDDALQKRLELRKREEEEELMERNKLFEEKRQTDDRRKKEAEEEKRELLLDVPAPNDLSEEWVDYTDSLGRSRRCLRKDLPELIKQDKSLTADNNELVDSSKLSMKEKDLMSEDMYREMLREKWEAEQRELLDKQETVHYANVRFDEKRTHGVGFYDFAKDEESRQEQLKALDELRNQTIVARERKEKLKEKRKVMTAARLAKVRQRKMINNPNTEPVADSEDEDFIGPSQSEAVKKQEPELLTRDETLRKDAPVREWDKGKKDTSTWFDQPHRTPEKSYIDSRRDERESEFAPPQAYFEQVTGRQQNKNKFPLRKEKKDIFKKLDPMAALDEGHNEKRTEFGPPSDYFSVPVKKSKLNPLASVEEEVSAASSINDIISSGLSSIRADVERKTFPETSNCADIRNIPLPPETVVELTHNPQRNDIADYQEHEMQFYPRHFVGEPQYGSYRTKQLFGQQSASDVTGISPSTASEIQYHSNQGQPGVQYNDNQLSQTTAKPFDKKESTQESTSLKQAPPVGIISAAPMMYDRAGSRVGAPVKPRYERVYLHQVPLTLPAPPIAGHLPHYPSQEDVHQTKRDNQEKDSVKHWYKQYSDNKVKPSTANIPFPSPYVQSESPKKDIFETTGFDPSKPPPNMSK